MLEKLFESLDEKVFTDELKESLEKSFNEAVELKAVELAEKSKTELSEKMEIELSEAKANLAEEAQEKEKLVLEQVDVYLEKVVDDFVTEAQEQLDESLKSEKADMILEAFDSMILATGVDVLKIEEAKDNTEVELKVKELEEKYDALVEDSIELEKLNKELLKKGVIAEMQEGLSVIESDKFAKLAELVEFSKDETYISKLETIKESVKSADSKIDDELTENTNAKNTKSAKSAWSHLV